VAVGMIQVDRTFLQYIQVLKEELNKDPSAFVPKYKSKYVPYSEWTEEHKQQCKDSFKRYLKNNPEKYQAMLKRQRERYHILVSDPKRREEYNRKHRELERIRRARKK
jgi:hypothetical protein